MKIECTDHDHAKVVKLTGRLDGQAPMELRKKFPAWLTEKKNIVIDCLGLEYIDSSGLGALISGLRAAINNNGDIHLARLQPSVKMMLELTRTNQVFKIFDTVEKALDSFQSESSRNDNQTTTETG